MEKHILSIWVENQVGILSKVVTLIGDEGVSIDSLAVGVIESNNSTRMTVVVDADEENVKSLISKMNKIPSLIKVREIGQNESLLRELVLIVVDAPEEKRLNIISIAEVFRATIVDVGYCTMTIEISGSSDKIKALEDLLRPFGIREIVRTGIIAVERGNRCQ